MEAGFESQLARRRARQNRQWMIRQFQDTVLRALQNDGDIYVTYWQNGHDANGRIRGEELMRARAEATPGLDGKDDKGGYHPSRQASNVGKGHQPYERRDRWGGR